MLTIKPLLEFYNKKEFKKVIEIGNQYLNKYPSDCNLLNIVSLAYAQDGELNKAYSILKKAYNINPLDEVKLFPLSAKSSIIKIHSSNVILQYHYPHLILIGKKLWTLTVGKKLNLYVYLGCH